MRNFCAGRYRAVSDTSEQHGALRVLGKIEALGDGTFGIIYGLRQLFDLHAPGVATSTWSNRAARVHTAVGIHIQEHKRLGADAGKFGKGDREPFW